MSQGGKRLRTEQQCSYSGYCPLLFPPVQALVLHQLAHPFPLLNPALGLPLRNQRFLTALLVGGLYSLGLLFSSSSTCPCSGKFAEQRCIPHQHGLRHLTPHPPLQPHHPRYLQNAKAGTARWGSKWLPTSTHTPHFPLCIAFLCFFSSWVWNSLEGAGQEKGAVQAWL